MRNCPFCGESIEEATLKCPFCNSDVNMELDTSVSNYQQRPISNGFKVFITMFSTIPFIGPLVGIITAIVFMNSEGNTDKKSFGKALLIGSLVFVLIFCICCFAYMVFGFAMLNQLGPEFFEQFEQLQ